MSQLVNLLNLNVFSLEIHHLVRNFDSSSVVAFFFFFTNITILQFLVLDVVWYKNDKLQMNSDNLKITLDNKMKKTVLAIEAVTRRDEGEYTCKATSDIGLAVTKARVKISGTAKLSHSIYTILLPLTCLLLHFTTS